MNRSRLVVFVCIVTLGALPAVGQELTVLQIEVFRDNSLIARPQLVGPSDRELRLYLNAEGSSAAPAALKGLREDITVTPTVRGDEISLALHIASGDKQFRPSLVISRDVRGSVEWTAADGQRLRISVAWVR